MRISDYASTFADLQKLSDTRQSQLLLARLAVLENWNPNNCPIKRGNLRNGSDLADGYHREDALKVCDLLLDKPWNELLILARPSALSLWLLVGAIQV